MTDGGGRAPASWVVKKAECGYCGKRVERKVRAGPAGLRKFQRRRAEGKPFYCSRNCATLAGAA
jgi:hypothetical protein